VLATIIVVLGLLVVVIAIVIYNKLVRLRNTMRSSWSDIDVQLKKRHDLVPNLVDTVKGYAAHEKGVFEEVTETRARAMQSVGPNQAASSENTLMASLGKLFMVAEAYPDLKANENFLELQGQFRDLEDNIESARRYYNAVVRDYNTAIETFPSVIVASSLGFRAGEFFQLESPDERNMIRSDF
jgi:LemA protein